MALPASTSSSSNDVQISVSAPGKVILYGEHSVVYGKLAIAGSLGLRTRITLQETVNAGDSCTLVCKTLNLEKSFDLNKIQKNLLDVMLPLGEGKVFTYRDPHLVNHTHLLLKVEEFLATSQQTSHVHQNQALTAALYLLTGILNGLKVKPFKLIIDTDLTLGAGCGSSASFSVCLAAIFILYNLMKREFGGDNEDRAKKKAFTSDEIDLISNWAFCSEKIMHGTPSGIDNTICAHGSLLAFRKGKEKTIIEIDKKLSILLINTKVTRNTRSLVANVRSLYETHPDVVDFILNAMDKICESAAGYFQMLSKDPTEALYDKLGELVSMNHNLLRTLNVSHPSLEKVCDVLSEYGLHGKLTGAGGGGYALALIPPFYNSAHLEECIGKLQEADFDVTLTDLGGPGIMID